MKLFESDNSVDEAAPLSDVRNPLSLLNQDSLIDDEAMVPTIPSVPVNAKPWVRDGIYRVPTFAIVDDEYPNDPRVVDELEKVLSADHVLVVVVPNARVMLFAVSTRGYVNVSGDDPVPAKHVPFTAKHPPVIFIPLAKDDVAVEDVTFNRLVCIPPWNVEVAVVVAV